MENRSMTTLNELFHKECRKFLSRKEVCAVTGAYTPETLSNYDYNHTGIEGKIRIGRKVFYPTAEVQMWIARRLSIDS